MKRVIQRKAKQGICDELLSASDSLKKRKRASQDIGNKTRTSAAMLGLALSFGASGSILSCHNKRAVATEPPSEGISSVQEELEENFSTQALAEPTVQTFAHVIREGETLWTLADYYSLSSETVAKVNGFENDVVLSVGQTVQIPHTARIPPEPVPQPVEVSAVVEEQAVVDQLDPSEENLSVEATEVAVNNNLAHIQVKATTVDISQKILDKHSSLDSKPSAESFTVVEQNSVINEIDSEVIEQAEIAIKPSANSNASQGAVSEVEILREMGHQVTDSSSLDAPALDATVSVSIDQPLLVGEPIAFSTLEDEPRATPALTIPGASLQPVVVPNVPETHQIQAGETLASIAQRYGISTQQLATANGIRNPNRIFAGRVLNLPDSVSLGADPVSVPTGENVVAALDTAIATRSLEQAIGSGEQDVQVAAIVPESDAVRSSDFYVQRLLSEIETISADYRQSSPGLPTTVNIAAVVPSLDSNGVYSPVDTAATADAGATLVDEEELLGDSDTAETEVQIAASVINPQFPSDGETAAEPITQPTVLPEATVEFEETQLLAAAPLGSENYVPLSEPVTGRMVSPSLPPLLAPDNYLPTVPTQFNGYIYPAQGTLTSGYGWRWGRMHRGIDVAAPIGTPIVAAAPGVVEFAGWNSGGYGNMVDIRHSDGSRTRYAHNNRNLVRVGQQVSQGEQIAEMGSTGYSTGPHVHFEIHLPEQGTVNPIAYLSR
ncbi:MAG: peptidoglycan DD-metalloendopeptidase family protein [Leptolyngbyaceae bacterium]|nr:peptidoglycan DD-metalloendopeptidase family protein [Leptolyngbyaceae bacterium]